MPQLMLICPVAVLMDAIIGDPRSSLHPVALIGRLIVFLECRLLHNGASAANKRINGMMLVLIVIGMCYGLTFFFMQAVYYFLPMEGAFFIEAAVVAFTISPRSLVQAGLDIRKELVAGDLTAARRQVGMIVGRDTQTLEEAEITRATVETMSENIVDGILSPLLYALLGGAPLAMLYRAVNTMDSMLGYRNARYSDFGMVAARTDDVFNYIPARISGVLIVIVALFIGFNANGAASAILSDAAKHPSPNSGISEAGVAGALGVQLGGLNYYGGIPSQRATMGVPLKKLNHLHILQTAWFVYGVTMLFCLGSALFIAAIGRIL